MSGIALLESNRHPNARRLQGGAAVSLTLHLGLLAMAIAATSRTRSLTSNEPVFIPIVRWPAQLPLRASAPKPSRPAPSTAHGRPLLPPLSIPSIVPAVASIVPQPGAISLPVASAATPGGSALPGADSGADGGLNGSPFGTDNVDIPAAALGGQRGPVYPEGLQRMGISGRVVARFIVGINGRVEGTPTILSATSPEFAESVERYLSSARYRPAVRAGRAVRQLAEQEFLFEVRH